MSAAPSGSLPPLSEEERAIFANAIRQARMLQRTLGPLCEVAIHDFRDLEHSLIHLEGSLTGRKLGAPITNIVVKAWRISAMSSRRLRPTKSIRRAPMAAETSA